MEYPILFPIHTYMQWVARYALHRKTFSFLYRRIYHTFTYCNIMPLVSWLELIFACLFYQFRQFLFIIIIVNKKKTSIICGTNFFRLIIYHITCSLVNSIYSFCKLYVEMALIWAVLQRLIECTTFAQILVCDQIIALNIELVIFQSKVLC